MKSANPFRVLLDEGVPDSVGTPFIENGHTVIFHREVLTAGVPDDVVCATALRNNAILVAADTDMKRLTKRYGAASPDHRFARLSLIHISCNAALAAKRVEQALSLLEHEWAFSGAKTARRLWVDIGPHFFRTNR